MIDYNKLRNAVEVRESAEVRKFSDVRDQMAEAFGIDVKDERFWFLLSGYADARDGKKCNLWDVVRMGYDEGIAGKMTVDKRNEWIAERQEIYEKGFDFCLSGNRVGPSLRSMTKEYVKRIN